VSSNPATGPVLVPVLRVTRRVSMAGLGAALLAGCNSVPGFGAIGASAPAPALPASPESPPVIPGKVRVGLILPLTAAGNGGIAGTSLKNAAELAVDEYKDSTVQLLVKDDRGTADGGREAAQQALSEGAEIIIGPLFAPSVQAVGQVARAAGKPVIAFSTDASVASKGVYLLSFMPESDVDTILEFAASRGKRSIAALVPSTAYGSLVAASFQEIAARRNIRVAALERYAADKASIDTAVKRIAALGGQADALLIPDNGDALQNVGQALLANGIDSRKIQMLGTGVWDDPRVLSIKAIQGGWYSAPDKSGFSNFAARYRARYNSEPMRIATLAYDAVFLVNALYKTYGASGFSEATITSPDGIIGTDGLFRFRPDGTNQRGLAVLQVGSGGAPLSPAPRTFPAGT
jgi:branched-chain amino acid transport system substrate-binding protein